MNIVRTIASIILLVVLTWVGVESALLVRNARQHLFELSYLANDNLLYLRGTLTEVQNASTKLSSAATKWEAYNQEQIASLRETNKRLNRILAESEGAVVDARKLIARFDANVNNELLPAATADLEELRAGLVRLRATIDALQAIASDPKNAELQARALALLQQGESTLAAAERVMAETEKIPPVVRKTLWTQILSTAAITLKTILTK